MNREILFRGKRADNSEWIEGSLLNFRENTYIIPHGSEYCYDDTEKLAFDVEYFEVVPSTIEQFTGLTDKNGVKIFEGDILKFKSGNYVVEWCNEHSKFLQADKQFTRGIYCCIDESEVIGNIHDNPELMKGEPNV